MNYTSKSMLSVLFGFWIFTISAQEQSLLFKVSGNGLKHPSYVFGTIHLVCENQFAVSPAIRKAFDASEKLFLEVDLSAPDIQLQFMQHALEETESSWVDNLTEDQVKAFDLVLQQTAGASVKHFSNYKPFFVLSMLTLANFECENTASYELFFVELARELNKEVKGLETVAEQFTIFDSIPRADQIKELVSMVMAPEESKKELNALVDKYAAGDLQGLYEAMMADSQMGDYQELLLDRRNERWIPKLEKAMKRKPLFIAVGAGHLPGDKGVIQLLRNKGYSVEPVID